MAASIATLLVAGLAAGFVAGLVGVGGGIIFAPVLLFYFQAAGVPGDALTPLTLGTSLMCTLVTSSASMWHHHKRGAVRFRPAIQAGIASAAAIFLTTTFVTTKPWYNEDVFQVVFSAILLAVAIRMLHGSIAEGVAREDHVAPPHKTGLRKGGGIVAGGAAGVVASATGVGGGVVLVPAYNGLLRMPIHVAVGSSSATIILISLFGVLSYAILGVGQTATSWSVGFVDPIHGLLLSVPATLTARLGVATAHRINRQRLSQGFALFAILVAARLIMRALT